MDPQDYEDISDDEIEARQRAEDGEEPDHDPTPGQQDGEGEGDADPSDGSGEGGNADAGADDDGAQAKADAATGDAASAAAGEKPAGGEAGEGDAKAGGKVDGVLSKDGSRVLPYGALQAARRDARRAETRAERLERELEDAKQTIADMKAGRTPEAGEVTEEQVRQMEADFPEQGKIMRRLFDKAQAAQADDGGKPGKGGKPDADEPSDDPVQDAIDQVPLLLDWQTGDAEKFARAQEIDSVLVKSPKWAGKPAVERFTQVARMVADEYDIPFPEPKAKASTSDKPAGGKPAVGTQTPADKAPRKNPETLSDFKGGSVADHGSIDVVKASPTALLTRMQGMSDDEIDAHLAKYG